MSPAGSRKLTSLYQGISSEPFQGRYISASVTRSVRRTAMPNRQPLLRKSHITTERPPFERIALVLQGGGALGAYQGGVYQALAEANLHPDWVSGISIGALIRRLLPAIRRKSVSRDCGNSGKRSAPLRREYPIFRS